MGINAAMFLASSAVDFIGFIRPDADIETVGFTSTPLWQKLDEVTHDSDTTHIQGGTVTSVCPTNTAHDFEIRLSHPSITPSGNETITVRVVARHEEVVGFFVTRQMFFQLKQGTVVRATSSTFSLSGSYQTFSDVLTQAQKDSITDWNDVRIRCRSNLCVENSGDSGHSRFTQIEVEFA